MTRPIFTCLLFMLTTLNLFAQIDSNQVDSPAVQEKLQEDRFSSMLFSTDYSSNSSFLGSISQFVKQPSYSPSVSFFHKTGLDISATAYFIDNSNDSLNGYTSELDLIAGYTFKPFRNFTIYPEYTHFMYSANSNVQKSIFSDEFDLDADYATDLFDLGLTAGCLLGKEQTFFSTLHGSYGVEFKKVILKNSLLSLHPGIDFNFGNYAYLNEFYINQIEGSSRFYIYLLRSPVVRRYVIREKLAKPDLTAKEIVDNYLNKLAEDHFKLTSISVSLPFNYMIGNFGINLGFFVCIPLNQPAYMSNDVQFYFDAGISYSFMPDRN